MEIYFILKDGQLFARFQEGDPSRFGEPFNYALFLQEFKSCVFTWKKHGISPDRWSYQINSNELDIVGFRKRRKL